MDLDGHPVLMGDEQKAEFQAHVDDGNDARKVLTLYVDWARVCNESCIAPNARGLYQQIHPKTSKVSRPPTYPQHLSARRRVDIPEEDRGDIDRAACLVTFSRHVFHGPSCLLVPKNTNRRR
jgi:hypothetical protein